MKTNVEDLQVGDRFFSRYQLVWTVIEAPSKFESSQGKHLVSVEVLWFDGGRDFRIFNPGQTILIQRGGD